MAEVHISCGTSTADLKDGSPTCTVSGDEIEFSSSQDAANIVSGDVVTYDTTETGYLGDKVSSTVWKFTDGDGSNATAKTDVTVNSIKRAANNIDDLMHGAATSSGLYAITGIADMDSNTLHVYIHPCADGDDDSWWTIGSGWTGDSTDGTVHIIVPRAGTNANQNQRHDATQDGGGYTVRWTGGGTNMIWTIASGSDGIGGMEIDGIKFELNTSNWNYAAALRMNNTANSLQVSNYDIKNICIVIEDEANRLGGGISRSGGNGAGNNYWRNIVIISDQVTGTNIPEYAINWIHSFCNTATEQSFIYNVSVYGRFNDEAGIIYASSTGGSGSGPDATYADKFVDCYVYNTDGSYGDYRFDEGDNTNSLFTYNGSYDSTAGSSNNNESSLTTPDFEDTTSGQIDLNIGGSSDLIGEGIGPSSDANVLTTDILGNARSGSTCDLGAFEYVPEISIPVLDNSYRQRRV